MIKNLIKNLFSKAESEASAAVQSANTYTDTSIAEQTTYSTTEQAVGTWIDGKTVYRRVFTGTLSSSTSLSATQITADSSVLPPNVIPIKAEGMLTSSTNQHIGVNTYLNANFYSGIYWTTAAVTLYYNGSNQNGWNYKIIIYYAK